MLFFILQNYMFFYQIEFMVLKYFFYSMKDLFFILIKVFYQSLEEYKQRSFYSIFFLLLFSFNYKKIFYLNLS